MPTRGRYVVPAVFAIIIAVLGAVWLGLRAIGGTAPAGGTAVVTHSTVLRTSAGSRIAIALPCTMSPAVSGRNPMGLVPAQTPGPVRTGSGTGTVPGTAGAPAPTRVGGWVSPGGNWCEILAAELTHRVQLDSAQRQAAIALQARVRQVVASVRVTRYRPGPCVTTNTGPACPALTAPFTQADVARIRQAMDGAGFRETIVRLSRPGDPGPAGALLYAVGSGPACMLGALGGPAGGFEYPTGRRRDGTCLAP